MNDCGLVVNTVYAWLLITLGITGKSSTRNTPAIIESCWQALRIQNL